jgi:hypothetical protein
MQMSRDDDYTVDINIFEKWLSKWLS